MTALTYPPGRHLLLDLHGCAGLGTAAHLQAVLCEAAACAEATVIGTEFRSFAGGGVTGVVLLAESHITIHTWPEGGFAAVDIFMCGAARPERAAAHIKARLQPAEVRLTVVDRGRADDHDQRNQASQPAR